MKLWILKPVENLPYGDNPWEPWYDKIFGFVVRAETEGEARQMAHNEAGEENRDHFAGKKIANSQEPWKDARYSSCLELVPEGAAGVILEDFRTA